MRQAAAEQGKGGYTQLVCDTGNLLQRRRAALYKKAPLLIEAAAFLYNLT